MAFLITHVADSLIRRRPRGIRPIFRSLPPSNKMKDDQDKTKRRLLSEKSTSKLTTNISVGYTGGSGSLENTRAANYTT